MQLLKELFFSITSWFRYGRTRGEKGILYSFEAPLLGNTRSVPAVIKAEGDWVNKFIPLSEFEPLFGGYITWHPTDEIGATVGVWGKRNVSRFRRILRERGAEFDVVLNEGPKQRPWIVTTHRYTKTTRRNLAKQRI